MNWNLHFMNARCLLTPYKPRIIEAVNSVSELASNLIVDIPLDIEFIAITHGVIPEIGFGGYSPMPGFIRVSIDPNNSNLASHMDEPFERMIAHELLHALRWETVGYGRTLLCALVSEGLAGRFAQELYGNEPELWESAVSEDRLAMSKKSIVYR